MESKEKINSFHIIKVISGEICLDSTNNSHKKINKIIKIKNKKKISKKNNNQKENNEK